MEDFLLEEDSFLPIAQNYLQEIISHISNDLKAPLIALNLVDTLYTSISKLSEFPTLYREYYPSKPLIDKYRLISVKNYIVLYVVNENNVEIRRIIYAKMDYGKMI